MIGLIAKFTDQPIRSSHFGICFITFHTDPSWGIHSEVHAVRFAKGLVTEITLDPRVLLANAALPHLVGGFRFF
jgi:hypothetical protein